MSRCCPGSGVHGRYTRRARLHRAFCAATVRRNVRADPAYPAALATGSSRFAVIFPSVDLTLVKIRSVNGPANPGAGTRRPGR